MHSSQGLLFDSGARRSRYARWRNPRDVVWLRNGRVRWNRWFRGGFWPDAGPDAVHSRALQRLRIKARLEAQRLDTALQSLESHDVDHTVVITHFAPTINTLGVEPEAKYWMLGNIELGRTIDRYSVDIVLHGHAHLGNPIGRTPNGILVRNVAQYVTGGVVVHELERGVSPWSELGQSA